jgi:hypothetical protein
MEDDAFRNFVQFDFGQAGSKACSILIKEDFMAKQQCTKCGGTGKCPHCKGTGRYGCPGVGPIDRYPDQCIPCQNSGVCPSCYGSGQQ